jgi:hypothetical protein
VKDWCWFPESNEASFAKVMRISLIIQQQDSTSKPFSRHGAVHRKEAQTKKSTPLLLHFLLSRKIPEISGAAEVCS